MQHQTTARPASMGSKRGIPLNEKLFAKAIAKAREVKPRVVALGSYYGVMQSDQHTMATVHFVAWNGAIYASCTCKAHTIGDRGVPVPCYHIAAAALHKGAASISADQPRLVIDVHHHLCPRCGDAFDCHCPTPDLNQICQDCDVQAFDAAQLRHNAAIERAELEAEIVRRWEVRHPHNTDVLLRRSLLARFGVSTLEALPIGTLQDICKVLLLLVVMLWGFGLTAAQAQDTTPATAAAALGGVVAATIPDDAKIKTCIAERLQAAPSLAGQQITVTVASGKATLSGTVQTTRQKGTATRVAKAKACGASSVVNELRATDPAPPIKRKPKSAQQ